jgi:hypothetical protein
VVDAVHSPGLARGCALDEAETTVRNGAEGDRTPDLSDAIRTLSQLSYGPREVES